MSQFSCYLWRIESLEGSYSWIQSYKMVRLGLSLFFLGHGKTEIITVLLSSNDKITIQLLFMVLPPLQDFGT